MGIYRATDETAPANPASGRHIAYPKADGFWYSKDSNGVEYPFAVGGVPTSNRNAIINGNFAVNQQVVAGTVVLAAGVYGHDMWKAGAGGCTYTFATVANVTTLTISAGTLQQVIEGTGLFSQAYVMSWSGTAQGKIGAGAFSASGVTGAAVGGTNLNVEFNTGTLSKVQLEAGSIATPFEVFPLGTTLQQCQRHYEKSYNLTVAPGGTTIVGRVQSIASSVFILANGTIRFSVRKRAAPTVSIFSSNSGAGGNMAEYTTAGVFVADRTASITQNGESGAEVQSASGNFTVGNNVGFQWVADARL